MNKYEAHLKKKLNSWLVETIKRRTQGTSGDKIMKQQKNATHMFIAGLDYQTCKEKEGNPKQIFFNMIIRIYLQYCLTLSQLNCRKNILTLKVS